MLTRVGIGFVNADIPFVLGAGVERVVEPCPCQVVGIVLPCGVPVLGHRFDLGVYAAGSYS